MQIKPLRSYRATLIPPGTDAHHVTGQPVLRAERVEEVAA